MVTHPLSKMSTQSLDCGHGKITCRNKYNKVSLTAPEGVIVVSQASHVHALSHAFNFSFEHKDRTVNVCMYIY